MRRGRPHRLARVSRLEQGTVLAVLLAVVCVVAALGSALWVQTPQRQVTGTVHALWYRADPEKGPRQTILQVRLKDGRLVKAEGDFLYPGFNGDTVRLTEFSTWAGYRSYRLEPPGNPR